jgi:hypothetical protein
MREMRRFSEALRSASEALAVAADAGREGTQRTSDSFRDSDDDYCCERHRHQRATCCAVCPHCGHRLEHRCCCESARTASERDEAADSRGAERSHSDCCCKAQPAPLPPYPPYPPMPAHAPLPPYPPFPPYPPYIIIAPGSGCGCQGHQTGASVAMPPFVFPGAPQPNSPPGVSGVPHTTMANPNQGMTSSAQDPIGLEIAPSFPNPASLTDLDALLDLGEYAVASVRDLVPTHTDSQELSDA